MPLSDFKPREIGFFTGDYILDNVFEKVADQPPRAASVLLGHP